MNTTFTKPYIARRITAGLIDYSIIYGFTFFMISVLGTQNVDGSYSLNGAPALIPMGFWFIMTVGLESGLGGTLGNSIVSLKAIPISGRNRKLSIGESLKRHILDPFDMFFFGIVGIITIKNTGKNQRIGDLWANTIVVKMNTLND